VLKIRIEIVGAEAGQIDPRFFGLLLNYFMTCFGKLALYFANTSTIIRASCAEKNCEKNVKLFCPVFLWPK
jgi:hypothetical protein